MRALLLAASCLTLSASANLGAPKLIGNPPALDKTGNPAVSVTGLALGACGTGVAAKGLMLQEAEAQFTGAVDSYFYGNAAIKVDGAGRVLVREVYATTLFIPRFTVKAGKFLQNFGANNLIHPHAQPLIDRPLVVNNFFGAEGLGNAGVEAAWRVPLPWHVDFIASAIRAEGNPAFTTTNPETIAGLGRIENIFSVTPETTLVLGGSASNLNYVGADATLKLGSSFAWTNEFISRAKGDWGIYSTPLLQVLDGVWAGGRLDYVESAAGKTTAENFILAYAPSNFSNLRAQVGWAQRPAGVKDWQLLFQYGITLGSHSLHAY